MAIIKCKMCGGDLNLKDGLTVAECEYCGSVQTVPTADNEKKMNLFARANRLRLGCEFDKAAGVYESIIAEFPAEAEAYWGLVLCRYGIEYVDDPGTGKKIPTCHRSSFDSVMDDTDFEQALENADAAARRVYRDEAKAIEELRKGILEVSGKEMPYDIFICYKETDANGDRTVDSVIAQDVYDALTEKGYRVFFSRISLEDKLGTEYEPYIFAALNSAKIMLAFGTDYEYFNAVWVKNEWSRFLSLIAAGQKKTLIPCYKGIDAYDMPKEFARLQAQDMGKVGAVQDLLRGIEKIMNRKSPAASDNVNTAPNLSTDARENAISVGFMDYEMGNFDMAEKTFRQVMLQNITCAEAYLGMLLICKENEQNVYGEKFKQYAPPQMSTIEKNVFTSKTQGAILLKYSFLKDRARIIEALSMFEGQIPDDVFIGAIIECPEVELIRAFISHGCNINFVKSMTYSDGSGEEPLLSYLIGKNASAESIKAALECGADPNSVRLFNNQQGTSYYSALSDSIWRTNSTDTDIVRLLLANGADTAFIAKEYFNNGTYAEKSMLSMAVLENNIDTVKLLLEYGADPNSKRLFRNQLADEYYSALSDSVWNVKNADIARILLEHGADVAFVNKAHSGDIYAEKPLLSEAVLQNNIDMVDLLLKYGADPNSKRLYRNQLADEYYSVLGDSIWNVKNYDMAKFLIDNGADAAHVDEKFYISGNREATCMLFYAVEYAKSSEMVSLLLEHGASVKDPASYKGRIITLKKYPFVLEPELERILRQAGWRGTGFLSKMTMP